RRAPLHRPDHRGDGGAGLHLGRAVAAGAALGGALLLVLHPATPRERGTTMATRARVGVRNEDGTVTSIYTHWDGYPEHHLPILTEAYATEERARALIALGDVSIRGLG